VGEDHDRPSLVGGGWSEERSITLGGYGDVVENGGKVGEEVGGFGASAEETGESREVGTLWRRNPSHGSRTLFLVLARVEDTEGDGGSGVGGSGSDGGQVGGGNLDVDGTDSMRARIFWESRSRVQAGEEGHHSGGCGAQSNVEEETIVGLNDSRGGKKICSKQTRGIEEKVN
jgi:hypothetical protein